MSPACMNTIEPSTSESPGATGIMKSVHQRHGRSCRAGLAILGCVFATGLIGAASAAAGQRPPVNLTEVSLEELLTIKVTSAGKRDQLITQTAAAVYVITADDIRRYNASTITDLLRQVPGILVARQATGEWSISIRGFNDNHANKLLVLMDGRTLYSPLYAGVEWDVQDTMIEDIERIEIVRGPGAALWGANAVNGVINIITKSAADTRGALVTFQGSTFERSSIAARYGGAIGQHAQYRLFTKYFNRPSLTDMRGRTPYGGWQSSRHGGRLDWSPARTDQITLTGDWSLSHLREVDDEISSLSAPFESVVEEHDKTTSAFLLGRWSRKRSDGSELDLRLFYDRSRQSDALGHDKDQSIETADAEFNHHLRVGGRHDLVWGGGFRQVRDTIKADLTSYFTPGSRRARTFNGFVQDEIALRNDSIRLTAGSKVEWNAFSHFEIQPTARLLWAPGRTHSVWTAVSRAVRVPSREEHDQYELDSIQENEDGAVEYSVLMGSRSFKPEKLTAYEAGYRFTTSKRVSLDVASFYNVYDDLLTIEAEDEVFSTTPIAGLMTPLVRANNARGRVAGAELTAFWTVNSAVQLSGNYTRLHLKATAKPESNDEDAEAFESKNAENLFYVRAYVDLPYQVNLTGQLRYVGRIAGEGVPAYVESNIHLSRAIGQGFRLNVSLDDLIHHRHAEWNAGDDSLVQSRSFRAGVSWTF
jgi:iron complex outermembrane recepter protein